MLHEFIHTGGKGLALGDCGVAVRAGVRAGG